VALLAVGSGGVRARVQAGGGGGGRGQRATVVPPRFACVAFIESASGCDTSSSCSGSDASEDADPNASPPRRCDGAGRGEERAVRQSGGAHPRRPARERQEARSDGGAGT
jgi:hypothetical protein